MFNGHTDVSSMPPPPHFRVLSHIPWIDARYFLAEGGVSKGDFVSPSGKPGLNCALGGNDLQENKHTNREIVAKAFGVSGHQLITTHQESHSVHIASAAWTQHSRPHDNAIVAKEFYENVLGAVAADCASIILAASEKKIAGIIHGSRESIFHGTIGATVSAMQHLGAKPETIHAAIGPCAGISGNTYIINTHDDDFLNRALAKDSAAMICLHATGKVAGGRKLFALNMQAYAALKLKQAGIDVIEKIEIDTITDPRCYSRTRPGPSNRLMFSGVKICQC